MPFNWTSFLAYIIALGATWLFGYILGFGHGYDRGRNEEK